MDRIDNVLDFINALGVLPLGPGLPIILGLFKIILQALSTRSLEENFLLYRTRSQHVGSLSAVSAFLAAVQTQFISFTRQKNGTALQKGANVCFLLGVSLNVMGAATGLIGASSLPDLASLQEDMAALRRAIASAEAIFETGRDVSGGTSTERAEQQCRDWAREHYRHVTYMFMTGDVIAQWNMQSLVYALVMLAGVGAFFLGLILFVVDTQPRAVWLTVLLISVVSYSFVQGAQVILGTVYGRSLPRSELLAERRHFRKGMRDRQSLLSAVHKFCKDNNLV